MVLLTWNDKCDDDEYVITFRCGMTRVCYRKFSKLRLLRTLFRGVVVVVVVVRGSGDIFTPIILLLIWLCGRERHLLLWLRCTFSFGLVSTAAREENVMNVSHTITTSCRGEPRVRLGFRV